MTEEPKITLIIAAPPEAVWDALRDRERIRHWHGWEFEGGPDGGLDQEIETIYFTDVTAEDGVVHLNGGDRVEVEAVEGGTRVTLTRPALSGDSEWDAYYDDITEGWITFLQQLRFAVERHPRGTRRTVALRGRAAVSPSTALDADDLQDGDRFQLALPDGAGSGSVLFRSVHQLGLVVDDWDEGLAVLTHDPSTGAAMALLSLYDMDEDRRAAIEEHWDAWWRSTIAR